MDQRFGQLGINIVSSFKAIVIRKADGGQTVDLTDFDENELMDGDVTFAVEWSTVNYKDGLAITGKLPVVRRWPMIPGIDGAARLRPPRTLTGSRATRSFSTAGVAVRPTLVCTAPRRA